MSKETLKAKVERLENGVREYAKDADLGRTGLNAVLNDNVEWFGGSRAIYRVGLTQRDSCHGGVVLVRFNPGGQAPYTSVHYFEQWFHELKEYGGVSMCKDLQALVEIGYEIQHAINVANMPKVETVAA